MTTSYMSIQRMWTQLFAAVSLLSLLPLALALEVGDQICVQGFIMDYFCIQNVNMIDNGRRTLEEPELHTVHCLADVGVCLATQYEVLVESSSPLASNTYSRGYRLDEDSKTSMLELARSVGSCSTCANGYDNSMLNEGFRAVMIATVMDMNPDDSQNAPPLVRVDDRRYSNQLGSNPCRSEFNVEEGVLITQSTVDFESVALSGSLQGSTLETKINLSDPNANGQDTITIRYTVPQLSWVAIGVNPTGTGMVNGEVVIGRPSDNTVLKYRMTARSGAAISEQPNQTLINPSVDQTGGTTVLTFTKLLDEAGEYSISVGSTNTFIAAFGFSNTFGFHQGFGVQNVMLAAGSAPTDAPVAAPTEAPIAAPPTPPPTDDPNVVEWSIQPYDDRVVKVGETITFIYSQAHNVYIHPTGTCDETDRILVGDNGGPASYTFTANDAERTITFACDVGSHCEVGQIINFRVEKLVRKEPKGASKEGLKEQRQSPTSNVFGGSIGSIRGGGRHLSNLAPQESS